MYKDIDVFLIDILVISNRGSSSKSVIHHMPHSQRTQFIKHLNECTTFITCNTCKHKYYFTIQKEKESVSNDLFKA